MDFIKKSLLILFVIVLVSCSERDQPYNESMLISKVKEVLLIGIFHFNNPGKDVAKTKGFNILSEKSQLELQEISSDIKGFNPTKIFVEWPYDERRELDSLYQLYIDGTYFNNNSLSDFYKKMKYSN